MRWVRDPRGQSVILRLAALYNIVWGSTVVIFPELFFELAGLPVPIYSGIWQCVGMIVGVYGVGYAVASFDPLRHWPIVLVGLLGKILGPIGFLLSPELNWSFGIWIVSNDLIWWVPFGYILYMAYRLRRDSDSADLGPPLSLSEALQRYRAHDQDLLTLSEEQPILIVFLRHAGCTFCREALGDLGSMQSRFDQTGSRLVVVHMGSEQEGQDLARRFGLQEKQVVSDSSRILYRAFRLYRGSFRQLFGLKVWLRGIWAGLVRGLGAGLPQGDPLQMPGVFLVDGGKIVREFRHQRVSDRPDYVALASCGLEDGTEQTAMPASVAVKE